MSASGHLHGFQKEFKQQTKALAPHRSEHMVSHYFASNDAFPLPELLGSARVTDSKEMSTVTLVVGESDVFSILNKIAGNVIVCDADSALLDFIDATCEKLLDLYDEFNAGAIAFPAVVTKYHEWLESYENRETAPYQYEWKGSIKNLTLARAGLVGKFHFLYNEDNFRKAMAALREKEIVTLHIDLFNRHLQDYLVTLLKSRNIKVSLFNLTNLPNYDPDNQLQHLLENLPWTEDSEIIWSYINSFGPFAISPNVAPTQQTQYLFRARNPREYLAQCESIPALLGAMDRVTFNMEAKGSNQQLTRYAPGQTSECPADSKKQTQYLAAVNTDKTMPFCETWQSFDVAYPPRTGLYHPSFNSKAVCVSQIPYIRGMLAKLAENKINEDVLNPLKIEFNDFYERYPDPVNKDPKRAQLFLDKARFFVQLLQQLNQLTTTFDARYQRNHQHVLTATYALLRTQLFNIYQNFTSEQAAKQTLTDNLRNSALAKHRGFNTEQHDVCRRILNACLCIPVLGWAIGAVKHYITGSFWFHEKTFRERCINEGLNRITPGAVPFVLKRYGRSY